VIQHVLLKHVTVADILFTGIILQSKWTNKRSGNQNGQINEVAIKMDNQDKLAT
jgi:hypothetical protein